MRPEMTCKSHASISGPIETKLPVRCGSSEAQAMGAVSSAHAGNERDAAAVTAENAIQVLKRRRVMPADTIAPKLREDANESPRSRPIRKVLRVRFRCAADVEHAATGK